MIVDDAARMAGQRIWIGIPGTVLDEVTRRHLGEIQPGGIVLFKRNIESASQLRALIASLRLACPASLRLSIDHEGGRVDRFSGQVTHFPGSASLARIAEEDIETAIDLARRTAYCSASELRALGIDVNFAPVADVSLVENPILEDRTFGSDPQKVARLVAASVEGQRRAGVEAVVKHFPGLGGARSDPHRESSRIEGPFDDRVLGPFRAGLAAGAQMVMTTHVVVSAFGEEPATFSRGIVVELLRRELGFDGLVISDSIEMKALADHYSVEEIVRATVAASHDLLCIGMDDFSLQHRAHAALADAYRSSPDWIREDATAVGERLARWAPPEASVAHREDAESLARQIREADPGPSTA